tara:strand:+ start:922 stop:1200 length:279 start_codon:yes stop_codon:yes gene_type:complete
MMAKAMEKYKIAEEVMVQHMQESGKDQFTIYKFKDSIEKERQSFKHRTITWAVENTPDTFRDILGFEDWDSAMKYLVLHRDEAFKFWRIDND